MARKVTLQTIADELHLTPSAVSRALSGKKGVSEQTRRRIIATARRRGYVAKIIPAPLTVQVVLLVEQRTLQEKRSWSHVTSGLVSEMALHDSFLSIVVTDADSPTFTPPPLFEQVGKVDGVVAIDKTDIRAIQAAMHLGLPVILVGYRPKCPGCDTVVIDDYAGIFAVATDLVKMGNRRFGFVGSLDHPGFRLRYEGLLSALVEANVTEQAPPHWERPADLDFHSLPTVLFCGNDNLAVDSINLLLQRGVHVPDDVSVIGFDDNPEEHARCPIPLTTMHVDLEGFGRWAVRTLFQRLNHPEGPPVRVVIGVEPVWRQSTAAPAAAPEMVSAT